MSAELSFTIYILTWPHDFFHHGLGNMFRKRYHREFLDSTSHCASMHPTTWSIGKKAWHSNWGGIWSLWTTLLNSRQALTRCRERKRESNTQGWEGERQTSGARQNGREMVKTDRETDMSQSSLLLLTFQPYSQLAYIPVRSCCSSSPPLTLAVCCSVHCCVTVSALESLQESKHGLKWTCSAFPNVQSYVLLHR